MFRSNKNMVQYNKTNSFLVIFFKFYVPAFSSIIYTGTEFKLVASMPGHKTSWLSTPYFNTILLADKSKDHSYFSSGSDKTNLDFISEHIDFFNTNILQNLNKLS